MKATLEFDLILYSKAPESSRSPFLKTFLKGRIDISYNTPEELAEITGIITEGIKKAYQVEIVK